MKNTRHERLMAEAEALGLLHPILDRVTNSPDARWGMGRAVAKTRFAAFRAAGGCGRLLVSEMRARLERNKDFVVADFAKVGIAKDRDSLFPEHEAKIRSLEAAVSEVAAQSVEVA